MTKQTKMSLFMGILLLLMVAYMSVMVNDMVRYIDKNQKETIEWRQTIKKGDSVQVYNPVNIKIRC